MHKGYIDNTQVKQSFFNGQKIQRIYYNGILGFEAVIRIPFPVVNSVLTYNGKVQTVTFDNYNNNFFTVTGVSATNAGTYTAVFQLKEGYGQDVQDDNAMYASYSLTQTIKKQPINKPYVTNTTLRYNNNNQNITSVLANYNSSTIILSGATTGKNTGTYTAYANPGSNYCQSDGTSNRISLSQKINKMVLAKPYLSGPAKDFAFDSNDRTWTVINYNGNYMTQNGSTTFKAASYTNNTYTETIKQTLKDTSNYQQADGSVSPVTDSQTVRWISGVSHYKYDIFNNGYVLGGKWEGIKPENERSGDDAHMGKVVGNIIYLRMEYYSSGASGWIQFPNANVPRDQIHNIYLEQEYDYDAGYDYGDYRTCSLRIQNVPQNQFCGLAPSLGDWINYDEWKSAPRDNRPKRIFKYKVYNAYERHPVGVNSRGDYVYNTNPVGGLNANTGIYLRLPTDSNDYFGGYAEVKIQRIQYD